METIQLQKVEIKRDSACLRTCFYDGLEVDHFVFYSKGKVLYKGRSSFLEDQETGSDITRIRISKPKRANKLNLDRKDNFYITGRRKYNFDKGYIFYINCDLENIKITETDFIEQFKDEFQNTEYKYKWIEFKKGFTLLKSKLNKDGDLMRYEKDTSRIKVFEDIRHIRTPLGKKRDRIVKKIEDSEENIKLSSYDVEKLFKIGVLK